MRASVSAVLAALLCVARLPAQETHGQQAPTAAVVGLDDCIRLAFSHDAGLASSELETRIADARVREMKSQYVPSLSLQAGYSRLSDVPAGTIPIPFPPSSIQLPPTLVTSTSIRLAVQQPLFTGRRIASSVRQAEAMRDSSREDLSRNRVELRYVVTEAYWNFARAKAQTDAIDQGVAQAESHLADALKLLDQGMATNNDVLQARMRLEDARLDRASAANARDIVRVRLALLIGLPWDAALDIPDAPAGDVLLPPQTLAQLVSRALVSRPELRSARSQAAAQDAAADAARSGLFPGIVITGDYTLADPNQRVFPQSDQFIGTWSIGLLASIDVGRYPQLLAQEEQARNKASQARESLRRLADAVTTDVVRAYLALTEAAARLASLREETAQAEENDRVTQERYRQGIALSSESLDAQMLVVRARLRERDALFDGLVAQAALARAVGE